MKQGLTIVLATTVALATVASVHVFAPLPEGTSFRSTAKAAGVPAPSPTATAAPTAKTAIEPRQAPIPLPMRPRPAAWEAAPKIETAAAPPVGDPMPQNGVPQNSDGTFAKAAIEADGYKSVRNVAPGPDGTWRARALRGQTEVAITVDRDGRVSAD